MCVLVVSSFRAGFPTRQLLFLLWSQNGIQLRPGRPANLFRFFVFLLRGQGAIGFHVRELFFFILEDGPDFLFLIVGEVEFFAEPLQPLFGAVALLMAVPRGRCGRCRLTGVLGERTQTCHQPNNNEDCEFRHDVLLLDDDMKS